MFVQRNLRRVVLTVATLTAAVAGSAAAASPDSFTGVWVAPDTDGDQVRFAISAPDAEGLRRLAGFDPAAEACDGGPAIATGSGTVIGDTLTTTLTVRCNGVIHFVGSFYFTATNGSLLSDTAPAPYTRKG